MLRATVEALATRAFALHQLLIQQHCTAAPSRHGQGEACVVGRGRRGQSQLAPPHQEGALAHAGLLQYSAQRLQRVLQHVLRGQVDLGDHEECRHLGGWWRGRETDCATGSKHRGMGMGRGRNGEEGAGANPSKVALPTPSTPAPRPGAPCTCPRCQRSRPQSSTHSLRHAVSRGRGRLSRRDGQRPWAGTQGAVDGASCNAITTAGKRRQA